MPVERRDQRRLDLLTCTSPVLRDRIMRHKGTGRQKSLWPNRCKRIGSRFQALIGMKATGIKGMKHMLELNQTLKSPVREIRMRGSVRVLSPFDLMGKGR